MLIHSSGCHGKKFEINLTDEQMEQAFSLISEKSTSGKWEFGEIIGSVEIVDCVQNHPSIWAKKEFITGCWLTLFSMLNLSKT